MSRTRRPKHPFGNHAPDWEPTARDAPVVSADVRSGSVSEEFQDLGRERTARPSQADMRAAFGDPVPETDAAGRETGKVRWSIDMSKRQNRGKWKEISTAERRVKRERADKMNARPKARLVNRDTGEETRILAEHEDHVGRKGNLRAVIRWSGNRVLAGPDGMLFREWSRGKWEPLGRKCLGTPLDGSDPFDVEPLQISPSGELWQRRNGEWALKTVERRAHPRGRVGTAEHLAQEMRV